MQFREVAGHLRCLPHCPQTPKTSHFHGHGSKPAAPGTIGQFCPQPLSTQGFTQETCGRTSLSCGPCRSRVRVLPERPSRDRSSLLPAGLGKCPAKLDVDLILHRTLRNCYRKLLCNYHFLVRCRLSYGSMTSQSCEEAETLCLEPRRPITSATASEP